MSRIVDLTGQRFGRLVAEAVLLGSRPTMWMMVCDCGNRKPVNSSSLRRGLTKSCGCLNVDLAKSRNRANGFGHPHKGLRVHKVWQTMHYRCSRQSNKSYHSYGGRGITVCDRWNDYGAFLNDMGDPGVGFEIDRIDNNSGYSPENCRWVTPTQNSRNNSRNVNIEFNGKNRCLAEWAEVLGMSHSVLRARLKHGMSVQDAFTRPINAHKTNQSGLRQLRRKT